VNLPAPSDAYVCLCDDGKLELTANMEGTCKEKSEIEKFYELVKVVGEKEASTTLKKVQEELHASTSICHAGWLH